MRYNPCIYFKYMDLANRLKQAIKRSKEAFILPEKFTSIFRQIGIYNINSIYEIDRNQQDMESVETEYVEKFVKWLVEKHNLYQVSSSICENCKDPRVIEAINIMAGELDSLCQFIGDTGFIRGAVLPIERSENPFYNIILRMYNALFQPNDNIDIFQKADMVIGYIEMISSKINSLSINFTMIYQCMTEEEKAQHVKSLHYAHFDHFGTEG